MKPVEIKSAAKLWNEKINELTPDMPNVAAMEEENAKLREENKKLREHINRVYLRLKDIESLHENKSDN